MMKIHRSLIVMLHILLVQAMLLLCVKSGFGSCIAADASTMLTCEEIEECPDDLLEKDSFDVLSSGALYSVPDPFIDPVVLRRRTRLPALFSADHAAGSSSGWMMPLRI
jgi:hypothetical protein